MIYTVTFSPSLDYVVTVPEFETGRVNRATQDKILPGGKGINVSIVLTNLEVENKAIGFVSGFTGKVLKTLLREKGINSDFITLDRGLTRINVKLRGETETEINCQGPRVDDQYIGELYEKLDYLDSDDYLVLAGSIPDTMPKSLYMEILHRLKDNGLKVIVDATGDLLLNVLPYKPFLIKPNNIELGALFGVEIKDREDIITYGKKLMEKGARNVLVSRSAEGAILLAEDGNIYESTAPQGDVVNSVGAGDSMLAGFLAGYIADGDYAKALKMGVCAGSASAFSEELATKREVDALLATDF
ncbi:MAG: 1-phosphofructokinase [Lachnospiraceae bacterium]|nr:1-phosphofructokinase [Lachnospiraceae bacterium]